MQTIHTSISAAGQNNYETAFKEAARKLAGLDVRQLASLTGARVTGSGSEYLQLKFINEEIAVSYPDARVQYLNREGQIPLQHQILILHYLTQAGGRPETGELITFKHVPGGLAYYPAFYKRAIEPVIKTFSKEAARFIPAGEKAGGTRADYGDFSLKFSAFPRISLTYIIWKESDEFPADGNIIFDESITDYLTTEDIAVLCSIISLNILKMNM